MCGIAGFTGKYSEEDLHSMTACMAHRGPDEQGHFFTCNLDSGLNLGIGHLRLSIIDLEKGQQPMWNEDNSIAITFNGEIYNYKELTKELKERGHVFATSSDTEVIIHGYEEYGPEIVSRLEGMFAFGIWDSRNRSWILARDRFGIKPLYYMQPKNDELVFSSEIKPLLKIKKCRRLNVSALYHYLLYGWISSKETIFQGIFQLKPAHRLLWKSGPVQPERYWRLGQTDLKRPVDEWIDLLKTKFCESVDSHLVADVPVGITLSGGLDSSSVLAIMARLKNPEEIEAFTVSYGRDDDETPFSRLAAKHLSVEAKERKISLQQVCDSFRKIIWHLEEPIVHPVIGTTYFLAQFIREHLKVVLIGEGADELFCGYPHYRLFSYPFNLAPGFLKKHYFFSIANLLPEKNIWQNLLHPDLLDKKLLEHVSHIYDNYFNKEDMRQGAVLWEIENELTYNQLSRIDKLTMAHSVEARVPYLDRSFAEVAYQIPFNQKLSNGVEKYVLRQAMRDYLPEQIATRPKRGRGGTQAILEALVDTLMQREYRDLISREAVVSRGWFSYDRINKYFERLEGFYSRHHPVERRKRYKFMLALMVLEQWARLFLDEKEGDYGFKGQSGY